MSFIVVASHGYVLTSQFLHAHSVAVLEMFLMVGLHSQLETVLFLDPPHEAEVPGLGDGSLA